MCKINILLEARQAGTRDGRAFPIENHEHVAEVFSHQFAEVEAQVAYVSNFLAEMGARISPVNEIKAMI